jgi:hypothetical protein
MQNYTGKFDCIRTRLQLRPRAAHILLLLGSLCVCSSALAQSSAQLSGPPPSAEIQSTASYPELAWLARSSYCNPYFGLRLELPRDLKPEPIELPVQSGGHHMLLALHLQRLGRTADLFISASEEAPQNAPSQNTADDSARLAARQRLQQARASGLSASTPTALSVNQHPLYRLRVQSLTGSSLTDGVLSASASDLGNESSYFLDLQGHLLHVAIFSHDDSLAAAIASSIEHMELLTPGTQACHPSPASLPPSTAMPAETSTELPRLYYGPALPTALVESTLREQPGNFVPAGEFSHGAFTHSALGLRLELPQHWQPIPLEDSYQVTELMRDPTTDPDVADRRRSLFRACSRVLFAAADTRTDLVSPAPYAAGSGAAVHPALAIAAMPQGCIPDLVMPRSPDDRAASAEFATLLVRSLGLLQLTRGYIHSAPASSGLAFHLDGALPYQLPGEKLARRLSLRVSAIASGPWFVFVYSVTASPAQQRELESRIILSLAPASGAASIAAYPSALPRPASSAATSPK